MFHRIEHPENSNSILDEFLFSNARLGRDNRPKMLRIIYFVI